MANDKEYMTEVEIQRGSYDPDDYLKNQQWKFGKVADMEHMVRQKEIYAQEQRREELEKLTEKQREALRLQKEIERKKKREKKAEM